MITYKLIRTRRKTIALIVQRDGTLIVRAPLYASTAAIGDLIEKKTDWIEARQEQARTNSQNFPPKKYINGESFWFLGEIYRLEIIARQRPALLLDRNFRLAQAALPVAPRIFERWYRQQTHKIIPERVRWYAAQNGFTYKQVRITSARTRWGSCGSHGTLNFSWRLVMAPMPVIDYVIMHELVHLQIHNHSKEFWAQIKLLVPDYQNQRTWLNANGHFLNLT
jgi:predicted metal-dependent hydrolase